VFRPSVEVRSRGIFFLTPPRSTREPPRRPPGPADSTQGMDHANMSDRLDARKKTLALLHQHSFGFGPSRASLKMKRAQIKAREKKKNFVHSPCFSATRLFADCKCRQCPRECLRDPAEV